MGSQIRDSPVPRGFMVRKGKGDQGHGGDNQKDAIENKVNHSTRIGQIESKETIQEHGSLQGDDDREEQLIRPAIILQCVF